MNRALENQPLPPQELLANILDVTLGMSPSVRVSPPYETAPNIYVIDICVDSIEMAINLSIVTRSLYRFSDAQVSVNFYVDDCDNMIVFPNQNSLNSIGSMIEIFNSAFADNPLYIYAAAPSNPSNFDHDMYTVYLPHVIQFACGNPMNQFGNCSFVAAELFMVVLYDNFFGSVDVGFSTDIAN